MLIFVYLRDAWKNIRKKPVLSVLTILFLMFSALFFCVFARLSTVEDITKENTKKTEAFIQFKQYNLSNTELGKNVFDMDQENDIFTYMYDLPEDEETRAQALAYFDELRDFWIRLFEMTSEDFKVVYMGETVSEKILDLKNAGKIEEQHDKENKKREIEWYKKQGNDTTMLERSTTVNYIPVSFSFFEHERLVFTEGGIPTEEDLNYKFIADEENPILEIPVIVGSAFAEDYDIGDLLETVFSSEDKETAWQRYNIYNHQKYCVNYRIVGILSEENAVTNFSGHTVSTLSKNIIVPWHLISEEVFDAMPEDAKISYVSLLVRDILMTKLYINRDKEAEYLSILWDMLENSSLHGYLQPHTVDALNEIAVEIAEARDTSYKVIAIAIAVFSSLGVIVLIMNNQKDNLRDYSIHMISGASKKDILLIGLVETGLYILIADILMQYPRIYMLFEWESPFGFWHGIWPVMVPVVITENLVILLISFICNYISVSRISFSEILKRKD